MVEAVEGRQDYQDCSDVKHPERWTYNASLKYFRARQARVCDLRNKSMQSKRPVGQGEPSKRAQWDKCVGCGLAALW